MKVLRSIVRLGCVCFLWVSGCSATSDSGTNTFDSTTSTSTDTTSAGGGSATGAGGNDFITGAGGNDTTSNEDPKTCDEAKDAQSYIGCDFWPTVVANNVWSIFDYAVVVANAGDQTADITVAQGDTVVEATSVEPDQLVKIYLPWVTKLKGADADSYGSATPLSSSVYATDGAYHLVSSSPVTVYQFNALEYEGKGGYEGKSWASCPGKYTIGCYSFSNDASLLLPSTTLSGSYRVTGDHGWTSAKMGAYFAITATEDNTTVSVKVSSSGTIKSGTGIDATSAGDILELTMNAGDVAELVGGATDSSDLSGSTVVADKSVQLITGVPCMQTPIGTSACDHIEESVFPIETWGQHYIVTVPTAPNGSVKKHVVRFYGNVDGTVLTYTDTVPSDFPTSLDAGEVVEVSAAGDFEVEGDHEFAVASFMVGGTVLDPSGGLGDPSQSLATAVEQYRMKYVFLTPDDYDVSYVDVIQPISATVTIDGAESSVSPTAIGPSGYGIARISVDGGAHVLTATEPVGIQVIGYGVYTSYQYPGGLNLEYIAPPLPPN